MFRCFLVFSQSAFVVDIFMDNLITIDIPLKEKLPIMTKTYKLSPNERKAINDIFSLYIIIELRTLTFII